MCYKCNHCRNHLNLTQFGGLSPLALQAEQIEHLNLNHRTRRSLRDAKSERVLANADSLTQNVITLA
jgi:hypothetical protein